MARRWIREHELYGDPRRRSARPAPPVPVRSAVDADGRALLVGEPVTGAVVGIVAVVGAAMVEVQQADGVRVTVLGSELREDLSVNLLPPPIMPRGVRAW
jgi:hypothetical protein